MLAFDKPRMSVSAVIDWIGGRRAATENRFWGSECAAWQAFARHAIFLRGPIAGRFRPMDDRLGFPQYPALAARPAGQKVLRIAHRPLSFLVGRRRASPSGSAR